MNNGMAAFMTVLVGIGSFVTLGFMVSTNAQLRDKLQSMDADRTAAREEVMALHGQVDGLERMAVEWQHRAAAAEIEAIALRQQTGKDQDGATSGTPIPGRGTDATGFTGAALAAAFLFGSLLGMILMRGLQPRRRAVQRQTRPSLAFERPEGTVPDRNRQAA